MRMINDMNPGFIEVDEIWNLSAVPSWNGQSVIDDNNPDEFTVGVFEPTTNGGEFRYIGEYQLDGTPEGYEAARRNFEEVATQAAEKGYFRMSQLKPFEWY